MLDHCNKILSKCFSIYDPCTELTWKDAQDVESYFENQRRNTLKKINFKLRNVSPLILLKAEKYYRRHTDQLIKYYHTHPVNVEVVRKKNKLNKAYKQLLYVMLMVHYDELKKIPVVGRQHATHLSPVEAQNLLQNVIMRQILRVWIKSTHTTPTLTITESSPFKARSLPKLKRLKNI